MGKILGIDLGTNSIGLSDRDIDNGNTLQEQLDFFSSVIFKSGVGNDNSGEFSFAKRRTEKRSTRRLYQARKYRIWATLKELIKYGFCPLSIEDLKKWSNYDKEKGLKRQYPIDAAEFEQWVRLDFNGDGKADYTSPFQLRAELMTKQFDFSNPTDCYKLGRALYHIAQRRGFRSSKGETLKDQGQAETDNNTETEIDVSVEMKKSEQKKSKDLVAYMQENNLPTVGCAFAHLENQGIRVRNSEYKAVRSQYKDEIRAIFEFQKGLDINDDFYKHIISEKKKEGSIFHKRPLRSQKGLVGKCTLEPNKSRCPISHPEFEKFRAWSLINNVQYRKSVNEDWQNLTIEQKQKLFKEKFLWTKDSFKFQEIREWVEKEIKDEIRSYLLAYKPQKEERTINYKDNTNVSGCPICGRLKNLLGENWETWELSKKRINKKTGEIYNVKYTAEGIWHICFSFDEAENVEEFAKDELQFDKKKSDALVSLWGKIPQGYSMLSLKAIKNINRFLQKGLIYTDAVLLAKLPELLKDKWDESEAMILGDISGIIEQNRKEKQLLNIANALIANYKSLGYDEKTQCNEKFAEHNSEYVLQESDNKNVEKAVIDAFGEKTWAKKAEEEQQKIISEVANLYQRFFASTERDYYRLPKVSEALAKNLQKQFSFLSDKDLQKIYHPSMIKFYAPAKEQMLEDGRWLKQLGSPVIGALKNPMAMRVLHILRKQINALIIDSKVDEDTRIVVETARELNDANMRWAIEKYQRERENENKEFAEVIAELIKDSNFNGSANPNSDGDIDKLRIWVEQSEQEIVSRLDSKGKPRATTEEGWKTYGYTTSKLMFEVEKCKNDSIKKYRLWKEQNYQCIYTGRTISLSDLFKPNQVDFEHTLPRSISFDNSLSNLTVCDAHYNRAIKKNQIPTQLANYDEDANGYTAILPRLQPWFKKVETLKDNVEFWKSQSKRAQDKGRKDYCIRQRHLWEMELDYWQKKVNAFTMTEVTSGFRNSQLNDTRIITKYAYHYLKTVFNKVEVQNGNYTADFRKMLGVQSVDEKKSRDKHSHHAIDATMLTLIPVAAQRDKMLELFYQKQEEKKINGETEKYRFINELLQREIRTCGIPRDAATIGKFIEENILVNHVSKDQTLTPTKRKARKRGKEIFVKDKDGNAVNKWINGDCIRGQLHGETFYGAITQGQKDENGILLRNADGSIKAGEEIYYVVRRELKYKKNDQDPGFKTWDELEKAIVNRDIIAMMKKQFIDGTSFKDACEHGIYMLDKQENRVNKIRHIRCYTSIKSPLQIKKQTYLSKYTYKQNYYAKMGDLYTMCKYESKDKSIREYRIWSLFDISENRKMNLPDIPNEIEDKKRKQKISLTQQLKVGDMILLYNDNPIELKEMEHADLMNRLYVIRGFENIGKLITLRKHINARKDKELGKGESIKNYAHLPEKIRCGINTLKFLLQGVDFEIGINDIKWINL